MAERIIFHVDANSAFLSWSAAYRVKVLRESTDLRDVPSVVAGDKASRHSIILAKSGPAQKDISFDSHVLHLFYADHFVNIHPD